MGGRVVDVGGGGGVSVHVYLHMPACPNLGAWEGDTHAFMHATSLHACMHTSVMRAGKCPWLLQDGVT